MVKIAPSLLSANFAYLKEEIDEIKKANADWIHYDVMDGHFVPNISFGYSILKDVSKVTDMFLDVHLMISDPFKYVDHFIDSGASLIVFHVEAMKDEANIQALIEHIHEKNVQVGISIKPATAVDVIDKYLAMLDVVLVMSVEPGFGGQSFMESSLDKVRDLKMRRELNHYRYLIEIDGGINAQTGQLCKDAGVDVMVAGSYVFQGDNYQERIESLR